MAAKSEVRANFVVNTRPWETGLTRIEGVTKAVTVQITGGLGRIQGELRRTSETWKKTSAEKAAASETDRAAAAASLAAEKQVEEQRRAILAERLSSIRKAAAQEQLSKAAEIASYQEVLAELQLTANERITIEEKVATLKGQSAREAAAALTQAAQEEAQATKRAAQEREQADREAAQVAELTRKETLAETLSAIRQAAAAEEISKQQQIQAYREVLQAAKVTGAERRQIAESIANLEGQLAREKVANERRAATEKAKSEKDAAAKAAADPIGQIAFGQKAQAAVGLAQQVAGALAPIREELSRDGEAADDLRDKLTATFGAAAEEKAKLAETAIPLGFSADDAGKALQVLHKFGADSEDQFRRLLDASAYTTKGVNELSESFGKFEKFGDAKAFKALSRDLGATGEELRGFGAAVDDNNTVLLDTPARVQAAAAALRAYADVNFAGAAERGADATTRYKGEMELLRREIGGQVVAFKEQFAPAILGIVQNMRGLSDTTKGFIGLGIEFISTAASLGGGALQASANVAILAQNTNLLANAQKVASVGTNLFRTGLAAAVSPIGLVVIAIAGLGAAVHAYIGELEKANAAAEDLVQNEASRARGFEKNKDLIGKSAEEILKMGRNARDVGAVIQGLQEQVAAAREAGNDALVAKIKGQIDALQNERGRLTEMQRAQKAAEIAAPSGKETKKDNKDKEAARKEELAEALSQIKQRADIGEIGKQQEIKALRELLANFRAHGKIKVEEARQIEEQIASLQGQTNKEIASAREKSNKEALAEALSLIKRKAEIGELGKLQEIQLLKDVLAEFKAAGKIKVEEARQIEEQIASLQGQAKAEAAAAREKANKEDLEKTLSHIKQKSELGQLSKQQEISALNSVLAAFRASGRIKVEEARRVEEEIASLRGQAAKAQKEQAEKDKAQIEKLGKEKSDVQRKALQDQQRELEGDLGKSNTLPKIEDNLRRQLALTIQEIEAERDAVISGTKNEDVKRAAVEAAEAKIKAARAASTAQLKSDTEKQTSEMQKVIDKHKDVVAELDNRPKSQVGGKNSPLYSDASEGINGASLGVFSVGTFSLSSPLEKPKDKPKLVPQPLAKLNPQQRPQLSNDKEQVLVARDIPDVKPGDAPDVGKKVADSLKDVQLAINLSIQADGKTETHTVSGSASDLAAQSSIWNPDFTLGKP